MTIEYIVNKDDSNLTIKDILKKRLNISTRLLTRLKNKGKILLNESTAFVNKNASVGDKIVINMDLAEENDSIIPQNGYLEVIFDDEYYIAVNKAPNMVVHPCSYHPDGTVSNYLKYYLNTNNTVHPVNRLDKDTSGIVLFAKNEYAQELFNRMKQRPSKVYITLVEGVFEDREGTINAPISRKERSIIERKVDFENGQEAITHYKVIKEIKIDNNEYSLLEITLETGRTHQIRVHMAYIGHPIVGDSLYNKNVTDLINRQALHAYKLSFIHPITGENVEIVANIPEDMLFVTKSC